MNFSNVLRARPTCASWASTQGQGGFLEEVTAELGQGEPWLGEGEPGPQLSRETWPDVEKLAPLFYQLDAPQADPSSQQCLRWLTVSASDFRHFTTGTLPLVCLQQY